MSTQPYPDTVTVEIDSEIESIVPEFLEKRAGDCLRISTLLEQGAFEEIRILGHRMKGAGGSYGFDDISELGEIIEKAAETGDAAPIARAVKQLTEYLKRVTVVYV